MKDEAEAEDIADGVILGGHIFDVDDFWGDVAWGPTSNIQVLFGLAVLGQSKIGNHALIRPLRFDQNILRFDIPMHNPLRMHFLQPLENVSDNGFDLFGSKFLFGLNRHEITFIFSKSWPPVRS